jgi:hypothetical protein
MEMRRCLKTQRKGRDGRIIICYDKEMAGVFAMLDDLS